MPLVVHAAATPLILYLKSEDAFGGDHAEGLDAIGRLLDDGTAISIKYAVVRQDPNDDPYLDALLQPVPGTPTADPCGIHAAWPSPPSDRLP